MRGEGKWKGGGGGTGPLPRFFLARWHWNTKKKKKKNISNERNPLVAATQEFEEHGQRSAGWKLQYVRGEVRGFLGKIGNDKSECFSFVTVVEDNL